MIDCRTQFTTNLVAYLKIVDNFLILLVEPRLDHSHEFCHTFFRENLTLGPDIENSVNLLNDLFILQVRHGLFEDPLEFVQEVRVALSLGMLYDIVDQVKQC